MHDETPDRPSDETTDEPAEDEPRTGGRPDPALVAGLGPDGGPSKSAAKRDALAVRDLGAELAALGESERAKVPLPDDVRAAIAELNRIGARGARKRQLGYLAKRMRRVDTRPIEAALDAMRRETRATTLDHHRVEMWRDRLLGDGPGETPKEALTAFLDEFGDADRQGLRRLQGSALAERSARPPRPPRAARELFRTVRDVLAAARAGEVDVRSPPPTEAPGTLPGSADGEADDAGGGAHDGAGGGDGAGDEANDSREPAGYR